MEFSPLKAPPAAAARRRRRRVALLIMLAAIAAGVFRPRGPHEPADGAADVPAALAKRPTRVVPDSVRIKVEVLNATSTRGLGRLATAWLRDQGFDVVGTGTAPSAERLDSTLVLDRSGHADWAQLAAMAMGGARVEARPDSLRYVDLTVLIGRSWRPPPQSLYP
ncbi:MAG: LytR C-terminal domain-containing protein [Gemmatimonadetes bacterium]|nr:LytR C-terminal domain-containing protein [Gemmatimonadota bacterium]